MRPKAGKPGHWKAHLCKSRQLTPYTHGDLTSTDQNIADYGLGYQVELGQLQITNDPLRITDYS
ncbi:hypothetical protein [Moorena sp. SIO3H5]|uniref:hypothetical protein n=1 Tax=Moorena sp. SIO3H5 TaxID=2607834 RepID=UPI0013BD83A9|nr:hypothetical protein [Moorena sp. SIO3H5]NEO71314.1 hypothetical protein [Moorena sp. SIO3H5]